MGEQRVDDDVVGGQRGGVRAGTATARLGPAGLECDDRHPSGHRAGDACEADRITERLEVDQRHIGVVIVGPEPQQVVAAHVDLVAHRHECRDAGVALLGLGGDGDANAARLGGDGDATGQEPLSGERGVEPTPRRHHTEAVGPHDAHTVGAGGGEQLVLASSAVVVLLGEAGGDNDRRGDPGAPTIVDDIDGGGRRDGDDRQIGYSVQVTDSTHRFDRADRRSGGMDDADAPGERCAKVIEDPPAGPAPVAAGADDDDVRRLQDRSKGLDGGAPVPQVGVVLHEVGRRQVELDMDDAVGEPLASHQADGAEHASHRRVPRHRLGDEPAEPG